MGVPGIIVARTDAEAANLIDSRADERDQPFLLGVTNLKIPSYKSCFLAMVRGFYESGMTHLNGHLLYALPEGEYATATTWLERQGILALIAEAASTWQQDGDRRSTASSTRSNRGLSKPGRTMPGSKPTARPSPT